MKPTLRPGATRTSRIVVDDERTTGVMGDAGRVYSTPNLVRDLERACRDLLIDHADPNEDSVGMEVVIKHIAPTLPGMVVEITATVTAVDGRKVSFDVSAKDELEPIGIGSHRRFVIDKSKPSDRLAIKAEKLAKLRRG